MGRYFLWDSVVCLVHYEGFGFMVHGARTSLDSCSFLLGMATDISSSCRAKDSPACWSISMLL